MKRRGNKLTAAAVRAANKPGLYADGHNLYLQVSKYGTKAWLLRYMIDGAARKMGLGAVHTVSLAEARKRAAEGRLKVHDGIDPIDERKAQRRRKKLEAAKAITFKECAGKYSRPIDRAGKTPSTPTNGARRSTRRGKRVFPAATQAINDLPVWAIHTGLVLKALEPIWVKTPESASRVRGRIEAVLDWAKVRGYRDGENPARWRGAISTRSCPSAPS